MADDIKMPTRFRWPSDGEWAIVQRVYGDTLPFRQRVVITDAAGANGRPFTIPTSLLTSIAPATVVAAFTRNPIIAGIIAIPSIAIGTLTSFANAGYIMNVGPDFYSDLTARDLTDQDKDAQSLLVHETGHVWQGKNSKLALSYVWGSVISQCRGVVAGASTSAAYRYTVGTAWDTLNPEQQASLVEDWFFKDRESTTAARFDYIKNFVRKGVA